MGGGALTKEVLSKSRCFYFDFDLRIDGGEAHYKRLRGEKAFIVADCFTVDYVRVEITGYLTQPYVTYNKDTKTVKISYSLLQLTTSHYDVLAKGRHLQECPYAKQECYGCDPMEDYNKY